MSKNNITAYSYKGILFRIIMKPDTAYFHRADLERLVGSNLYSEDYTMEYECKSGTKRALFFKLEQLPSLAFNHNNRDLYGFFDFFSKYYYPAKRLHWFKDLCLKIYLFLFGKEKR